MRIGKPNKRTGKRGARPKNQEDVVGQVSSNLILSVYAPKLTDLATKMLEDYASDLLDYEERIQAIGEVEVEIGADGSVQETAEIPVPPKPPLFRSLHQVDEFSEMLSQTSRHFTSKAWKVHANAAKFERHLDEKYGIFRPFITNHPEIEHFIRSAQRKYEMGYFSPFRQGDPPFPRTTSIILLFMMHRGKMSRAVVGFSALYLLIGLQPWALIGFVALAQYFMMNRSNKPVGTMKEAIEPVEPYYRTTDAAVSPQEEEKVKNEFLLKPVGTPLGTSEEVDGSQYDTIILGSGPETLFAASLLSRAGRKVLVLCERKDASRCINLKDIKDTAVAKKFRSVPFDVDTTNISRISRQQQILAPALCTTTDTQGGIRFSQVGSQADGHAFEILAIPGMGADGDATVPFVLRADDGRRALMEDAATFLSDGWPGLDDDIGDSGTGAYLMAIDQMQASSQQFYISKIISDQVNEMRSRGGYQESAIRYASAFLEKCFPVNAQTRSLMAGIGMKGENIKPSMTSMGAHVTNVSAAMSGEGMYYPIGGPRALCHALANVVEQCGGRVLTETSVMELLFEEVKDGDNKQKAKPKSNEGNEGKQEEPEEPAPRCVGVRLEGGREIRFAVSETEGTKATPAVISMNGFIYTFIRVMPEETRMRYKVPRGLPALSESRPVFKILFGLDGSAEDLDVTGADYYRLPGAAVARDEVDPTGAIILGEIGWSDDVTNEEERKGDEEAKTEVEEDTVNQEESSEKAPSRDKRSKFSVGPKKGKKSKFDAGKSWIHISFPSAKDPSFESRHGRVTTCVVTIEADDDFVTPYDTKPSLYSIGKEKSTSSSDRERLLERVRKDLLEIYPQLEGKIEHQEVCGPFKRGLSHTPERYAAKGIRADTPFPGLFVGGSDLTVGDSFAGAIVGAWLVSNAVMGYTAFDHLFLQKNITSDLKRFLEEPEVDEDTPDLAVPYTPREVEVAETDNTDADPNKENQEPEAAESES